MSPNKFQCTRCAKNYIYRSGLTAHIKRKHPLGRINSNQNDNSVAAAAPRIVHNLINIGTQELERLLSEEQELVDAADEMEHNIDINESMVNWYNMNLCSSF